MSFKEADIDGAVGTLSMEECDVLMKYIYRGCLTVDASLAPLLYLPHERSAASVGARRQRWE